MIEFVEGPHKELALKGKEKGIIEEALKNCSNSDNYYFWLNMIYNNADHFFNPAYSLYIPTYLREIAMIANSAQDKIRVMGSKHTDTGHSSNIILFQGNSRSVPLAAFVSDEYIRFTVKLAAPRKLNSLNEYSVFHFLVDVPSLLWTGKYSRGTVILRNIPYTFTKEQGNMYYPKVSLKHVNIYREIM